MAITLVGVSSGTNSLTEPPHQAGDQMICVAVRDGSNTPPTSPGNGYSFQWDNTTNSIAGGLWEMTAANSTQRTLTFANATSCVCVVYRGVVPSSTTFPASSRDTGSGTTALYDPLTLSDASSWVFVAQATRDAGTTGGQAETPPSGMTLRVNASDATDELAAFDTDGPAGTTAWAPPSQTISTNSTGWVTFSWELIDASPGSGSTETITVDPGAATAAGQTIWLNVVDNPYQDLPKVSGTPPTGFMWPADVVGLLETGDGKIAFGYLNNSQIPGNYIDFATHNADFAYNFTSNNKYVRMEVHSGDQYYEDSSTSERSEMGTMRTYYDMLGNRYVFEWNSLLGGSAPNAAGWCTHFQMHPNSGGSPIVGIYQEGDDLVVITRSGTSGSPTETYRYSLPGSLDYDIYHRFTLDISWPTGVVSNASMRLDIDGSTVVNVSGVTIGHTNSTKFRFYWGVYRAETSETTYHQVKNIQVTIDPISITNGSGSVAGQTITPSDGAGPSTETIAVDVGSGSIAGQTITETEIIPVEPGNAVGSGDTSVGEDDTVGVAAGAASLAGQTVDTPADTLASDTISITPGAASVAGETVTDVEILPPEPVMGRGGGAGGPSSDSAYWGTRRREEAKREAERRRWKGDPATTPADTQKKPPRKRAEVKKAVTPEPEPVDPLQELLALMAAPDPVLTGIARPSKVYDPEDDAMVLLLTTF